MYTTVMQADFQITLRIRDIFIQEYGCFLTKGFD